MYFLNQRTSSDLAFGLLTGLIVFLLIFQSGCGEVEQDTNSSRQGQNKAKGDDGLSAGCNGQFKNGVLTGKLNLREEFIKANSLEITHYEYEVDSSQEGLILYPYDGNEKLGRLTFREYSNGAPVMAVRLGGSEELTIEPSFHKAKLKPNGEPTEAVAETRYTLAKNENELVVQRIIARENGSWKLDDMFLIAGKDLGDDSILSSANHATLQVGKDGKQAKTEQEASKWQKQNGVDEIYDIDIRRVLPSGEAGRVLSQRVNAELGSCLGARQTDGKFRTTKQGQGLDDLDCRLAKTWKENQEDPTIPVVTGCALGALGGAAAGCYSSACVFSPAGALYGCAIGGIVSIAGWIAIKESDIPEKLVEDSCSEFGQPYLRTGDGLALGFRGAGEFVWVRRAEKTSPFQIQIRQTADLPTECGRGVRIAGAAMKVGAHRVGFYPARDASLWIDGEPVESSEEFWKLGGAGHVDRIHRPSVGDDVYVVEWRTGERLRVGVFGDRLDLELDVPRGRRSGLSGLLGNFNENRNDDLQLRGGRSLETPVSWKTLYDEFAESWRLRPSESLFDYREGTSTETYTDRNYPRSPQTLEDLSDPRLASGAEACRKRNITDPILRRHCAIDVACTGDDSYADSFAGVDSPISELEVVLPNGSRLADVQQKELSRAVPEYEESADSNRTRRLPACGEQTGDPHLTTLDGTAYDFQAAGEFVTLESIAGDPFEIQTRLGTISNTKCPDVTYVKAVAARVGEHRVAVYADRSENLWIDGKAFEMPTDFISLGGGHGITVPSTANYRIFWPGGESLTVDARGQNLDISVYVPDSRRGQLQGILGRFNGEAGDDLVLRDGTPLEEPVDWEDLYGKFADSWRITDDESLFDYESGNSTATHTDKSVPSRPTTLDDIPASDEMAARKTCKDAGLKNSTLLRDCVIDVYCTGDKAFADHHAERTAPEESLEVRHPVYLDGWTQEGPMSNGDWTVSMDGRSVKQTRNGDPSFFVSTKEYIDTTIEGTLKTTSADDDFMGFVFGYQGPLSANGDDPKDVDMLLFSWKGGQQSGTPEGMTLARMTAWPMGSYSGWSWWSHKETSTYDVLATNYGDSEGWERHGEYKFKLTYTKDYIEISMDDEVVMSVTANEAGSTFPAGRFGFYNYSQASVTYSGFQASTQPAPPADVTIEPQSTYLRVAPSDTARPAAPIHLPSRGIQPGDQIRLRRVGSFEPKGGGSVIYSMTGVFSSSKTLLAGDNLNRVKDAIDAGKDVKTTNSSKDGKPTDIPEDFPIAAKDDKFQDRVYVTVPQGAKYLFVAGEAELYEDNTDMNGDYGLEIEKY